MKKIVTTDITPAKKSLDPKFRDLPNIIKPLVEEKSMEFVVKGDGPCFIRTTGAHIFGDEDEAPQLARDLNTHKAEYRQTYEEKISADFRMLVTIGIHGETKQFATSTEYFDWLQDSRKAAYMWRGCVDVIAMAQPQPK